MATGIFGAIMWAIETLVLGIALGMAPFVSSAEGLILAPFVSTFLHDAFSAIFMWIYNGVRGETKNVLKIFKSKEWIWLVAASAIGGPIGMTGYVLAVNNMGASIGALASAIYPAIGSILAYFFLKEKINRKQWIFLALTLLGVFGISYSPELEINNFYVGLLGAFMCAFGWGAEGVILSKCFKNDGVKSEHALQIRQTTSAIVYAALVLPCLGGWKFVFSAFDAENLSVFAIIAAAAFCATTSYLFYYKTIAKKGAAKAMALNITYTAWALVLSIVVLKNYSLLNPVTLVCAAVVVVCAVLSAGKE